MSKLLGTGLDACLVAGGPDAPEAVSRRRAVRLILLGSYLYGRNGTHGMDEPVRGWRGCIFDALAELHPEAAAHLHEHQDACATWIKFGHDPELDEPLDTEEEKP